MKALEFYAELEGKIKNRTDIVIEKHKLNYKTAVFDFFKIRPETLDPKKKFLLLRAGIHGEEVSGPLTILKKINEILDYAEKTGVGVIVYPLGNPSGFEKRRRFGLGNKKGYLMCNDFVRYRKKDGELVSDLEGSDEFKKWYWTSDPSLNTRMSRENKFMHQLLKNDPLGQIKGVLDLHQDYITPNIGPAAYHYAFGQLSAFRPIVEKIKEQVPVLAEMKIGAGENGDGMKSDENGFIVRHDGTLPDLFWRLGAKYCVTAETTGATPLAKAIEVNMIWILGMMDMLAG